MHVVYKTVVQNISQAQILSQISVLNKDYQLKNSDTSLIPSVFKLRRGDFKIKFCLAKTDPNGNATTGIIRKKTTKKSFSSNDAVKFSSMGGDNAWPADKYLNIWVCNLGQGLLGYAQFPGPLRAQTELLFYILRLAMNSLLILHMIKEELQHMRLVTGLIFVISGAMMVAHAREAILLVIHPTRQAKIMVARHFLIYHVATDPMAICL